MVEYLDAVIADTAVTAPGRPVELAGDAPLHPHGDPVNLHIPVERRPEVVIAVLVGTGPGDDARVHEGRHGEVDQDEDGDDALEDGDGVPLLVLYVPLVAREVEEQSRGAQQEQPGEGCRQEFSL